MNIELVGYLLDALEAEEVQHIEQALQTGVTVRQRLEVLRLALIPLEADREHVMPPAGLAARTCRQIRQRSNIATEEQTPKAFDDATPQD